MLNPYQDILIFIAVCYFHSTETKKHKRAWAELEAGLEDYHPLGHESLLDALKATDADNASIADVVEHSFQTCLDEACSRMLGTKIAHQPCPK